MSSKTKNLEAAVLAVLTTPLTLSQLKDAIVSSGLSLQGLSDALDRLKRAGTITSDGHERPIKYRRCGVEALLVRPRDEREAVIVRALEGPLTLHEIEAELVSRGLALRGLSELLSDMATEGRIVVKGGKDESPAGPVRYQRAMHEPSATSVARTPPSSRPPSSRSAPKAPAPAPVVEPFVPDSVGTSFPDSVGTSFPDSVGTSFPDSVGTSFPDSVDVDKLVEQKTQEPAAGPAAPEPAMPAPAKPAPAKPAPAKPAPARSKQAKPEQAKPEPPRSHRKGSSGGSQEAVLFFERQATPSVLEELCHLKSAIISLEADLATTQRNLDEARAAFQAHAREIFGDAQVVTAPLATATEAEGIVPEAETTHPVKVPFAVSIARVLAHGRPMTIADIARAMGEKHDKVANNIHWLKVQKTSPIERVGLGLYRLKRRPVGRDVHGKPIGRKGAS